MPTVATDTEALAAESQEKAVGNWGAIRCYKRCRRVGGTVSNCHAACPSNTETKVAGDISEALAAESQEKTVGNWGAIRCYKRCRRVGGTVSNCHAACPSNTETEVAGDISACDEAIEATMQDGSCCPYDNARWDWSTPTVVPDHPEECCEGIVSMDNPNECPAVETLCNEATEATTNAPR